MNPELLAEITASMIDSTRRTIELEAGEHIANPAKLAGVIVRTAMQSVASTIDNHIETIEAEYVGTYSEIMRVLEGAGIASADEHGDMISLPDRVRLLAAQRPIFPHATDTTR